MAENKYDHLFISGVDPEIQAHRPYATIGFLDGKTFEGCNEYQIFWVGDKPKLGSLSATLPDKSSSQLLGDRDEMLSKMIGERIASSSGKIALVSTNLPVGFEGRVVLRLLNELLSEEK